MATTQRSVEDAEKYINESIQEWKTKGQDKKIISLATFAERWRSEGGGPITRMRELAKSVRALEVILKRNEKVGVPSGVLMDQLDYFKGEYNDLVEEFGEPESKIKRKKDELPKAE